MAKLRWFGGTPAKVEVSSPQGEQTMDADEETAQALGQITGKLGEIQETQVEHGKTLAVLDERTQQHEKRMDRTDRRAGTIGSVAGGLVSTLLIGLKMLIPGWD
jgi:hypothetical protein